MNWTPSEVDRSFVGYNSVPMQPNELNVTTLIPPKMVVKITPCVGLWMNGMPNTDMPDNMKLKASKNRTYAKAFKKTENLVFLLMNVTF